jgi:FkbM family methyltransferase
VKKLFQLIAGLKFLQKPFEMLHLISIYGMNYGSSCNFNTSGERFALKYALSKLDAQKEPLVLFDVGANSGHYSMEIANIFSKKDYLIHSFEPSVSTFAMLKQTVGGNQRIVLNNVGTGAKEEILELYSNSAIGGAGLSSVYKRRLDHSDIRMDEREAIKIITIDGYCKAKDIKRIHFLKMDIEGHEYHSLLGAAEMLANKRIDIIQFEFGGCNIDSRTFLQDFWYLLNKNYYFYRIVKNGLRPIIQYKERLEIFKNVNFLLISKDL